MLLAVSWFIICWLFSVPTHPCPSTMLLIHKTQISLGHLIHHRYYSSREAVNEILSLHPRALRPIMSRDGGITCKTDHFTQITNAARGKKGKETLSGKLSKPSQRRWPLNQVLNGKKRGTAGQGHIQVALQRCRVAWCLWRAPKLCHVPGRTGRGGKSFRRPDSGVLLRNLYFLL